MNLYDAVCHSFTTIATGGFSTHSASIAYFHSSYTTSFIVTSVLTPTYLPVI